MLSTSLAMLALAASFPIHLHPHSPTADTRITVMLVNRTDQFRDVRVEGHSYTANRHQTLTIKAPAGTLIYADDRSRTHRRGDVLLEVTPAVQNTRIDLN